MKQAGIPRDTLKQIQAKAKQQFGLTAVSSRPAELYRKLKWIAQQQHIEEVEQWLLTLAQQPWTDTMREQVVPAFTVGETYFQRDPNATEWLAKTFFPTLIQTRQQQQIKQIDCWSAGCCTGEEAYGLLFLLNDLKPQNFSLNIVATDLNREFLQQAKAGRYRQGSFRSPSPNFQQRYFSAEGTDWVVLEKWRNRIQFEPLNLIECKPPRGHAPFDLILCRNVLMYFSQDDACKIIHMYVSNLRDDGVLLLGAVDASLAASAGYEGFWAGDNFAVWGRSVAGKPRTSLTEQLHNTQQSSVEKAPATPKIRPLSPATKAALAATTPSRQPKARTAAESTKPALAQAVNLQQQLENPRLSRGEKAKICLQLAQSMQQQNRLDDALSWFSEAVSIEPLNARAQVLLGQHYLFNQQYQLAADTLHKAAYLDANNIAAHFYGAQACQHLGRAAAAIKLLQHCLKLLQKLADNQIVEDTGELSVGHVRKLAEQLIHSGVTYAD
ncbi:MAG: hypothetical protein GYB30_06185 [Gammaproteobacteria bacterium]|jgi:chemotaxis protein methyltransferase CheR|nr:hypothetical protein [Gammaproteobacteria bacterium]